MADHDPPKKDIALRKLFNRRHVLAGGMAGAIAALAVPGAALAKNEDSDELAGLWHGVVSSSDNSFPAFQTFELYAAGIFIGSGQTDLQPQSLSSSAWG